MAIQAYHPDGQPLSPLSPDFYEEKHRPTTWPTVADTLRHPAYPTAVWNLAPSRGGTLPVAQGRGGPFNISWEVHGTGPIKLMLLMGLGALKSAWQRQTLYFGHEHASRYSVLLIDNRGVGDSDKPLIRYTTAEMARDVVEVLAQIGWITPTALADAAAAASSPAASSDVIAPPSVANADSRPSRRIHVAGLSLGGMMAQELALLLAPGTLSSMTLLSTAARLENTSTSFGEATAKKLSMIKPRTLEGSLRATAKALFPAAWLVGPDDCHLPPASTPSPWRARLLLRNPVREPERRFDSRYQRWAAEELHRRRDDPRRCPTRGFLLQLDAAGTFKKSPEELRRIGDRVGRARIAVVHGEEDGLITVPHGRKLVRLLQPMVAEIVPGMGHACIFERPKWINELLEDMINVGEELDAQP